MLKPLTLWITTNCGKFLKRWEYQTTLPVSWETCMWVKKQQLEPDMEQWIGSKLEKEYTKAVNFHTAYLNYTEYIKQNTRLDESQSGIKIVGRNINNLRWADNTTLMAESEEELRASWGWKRIVKKLAWTFKILRSWDPVPSLHDKKKGETWKQWQIFFPLPPKPLQIMTAPMKLKDACFLKGKLWQT